MSLDLLKTVPQYLIPQVGLSVFAGCMANVTNPYIKNYLIRNLLLNTK